MKDRPRRLRPFVREEVVFQGPGARAAFERARKVVFGFTVYDPRRLTANLPDEGLAPGVEFVQKIRVGPLRFRGPVRVLDVWDRPTPTGREAGFTYLALAGHPEAGDATFAVTLDGQAVRFRISSNSAPARWFTKLAKPMTRLVQRRSVGGAFRRMHATLASPR